ncbi:MAG: excalibur calcium-binding domain-containing protein [Acinetobacter sp.]|nr:MAG: excalibur calcium-binding domain-containing protein [Acinetobacter sp.]
MVSSPQQQLPSSQQNWQPQPQQQSLREQWREQQMKKIQQQQPRQAQPSASSAYRCDGRTHCSQMTSCAEATYFLRNCPNTQMDGNGDGIPCEKQWCR